MLISIMYEDKLIDKNSACDKLVDFCLQTLKSKELKTIDLQKVIPAFYSYCYHKFKEENINLKNIDYYSNEKPIGKCLAYASGNEIHFLKTLTQKEINPKSLSKLFNAVFHESKHISENFNPALKSNTSTPKKEALGFHATYAESIAEQFTNFATRTLNLPTKVFKGVYQNLSDYYNKLYYNNPSELSADNFADNTTLEILNYGLTKDISAEDKLLLENMKSAYLQLIDKQQDNIHSYDKVNIFPLTKKYINLMQKDKLEKLTDLTNKFNNATKESEKLKYGNQIITQLPILSHSLAIVYDENIAYKMAELTLSHIENGYDFEVDHFSNTIAYCGYPPTEEQFSRFAKCYQNRYAEEFKKEGYTPLTLFLDHLNKYYSYDFLLTVWSKDNPNFIFDLENCETELIQIDDKTKEKAIENYNNSKQTFDQSEQGC